MQKHRLQVTIPQSSINYEISVGNGSLSGCGQWARLHLGDDAARVVMVSDRRVMGLYGNMVSNSLERAGFKVSPFVISAGERSKNLKTIEQALVHCSEAGITKSDAVVALGGGVAGDIAGFAASVHLRGVPFLQVPTTLLSMIDASVGGKTGVNSSFGKNLIGSFYQPKAVLVDVSTLQTLPMRELTAGFCEAIKQGAVGGSELLDRTAAFLSSFPPARFRGQFAMTDLSEGISSLIATHIEFKVKIVTGDERESSDRKDARSRKILNFGHTLAHALEKVTEYRHLRHGEAVGYGILFAAELSKSLALCPDKDVELLNDVVHRAGKLPKLANIDQKAVLEAFRFDKKWSAGSLQMVLIKGIGKPVIVNSKDIPKALVKSVLKRLLKEWGT
jgi:3-dehydroquinate synthase